MGSRGGSSKKGNVTKVSPQQILQTAADTQSDNTTTDSAKRDLDVVSNFFKKDENIIKKVFTDDAPEGNSYNLLQKIISAAGAHGQGTVVEDDVFDSTVKTNALDGVELYRGVRDIKRSGVRITAEQIVDSYKYGDKTIVGDGIHGDGIYFSTKKLTAEVYAGRGNTKGIVQGYIDKTKAKVITEDKLRAMQFIDRSKGSTIGGMKVSSMELGAYALYKGYNVIHVPGGNHGSSTSYRLSNGQHRKGGEDYYVPLVRSVMVWRKNTK